MTPAVGPPRPRRFGWVNWRGLWTLYRRDAFRYLRYGVESIGGPAVSSLLFLAVFSLALDGRGEMVPGVTLVQFIAPGIVIFSLTHSAFESAAAVLVGLDLVLAVLAWRLFATGYKIKP